MNPRTLLLAGALALTVAACGNSDPADAAATEQSDESTTTLAGADDRETPATAPVADEPTVDFTTLEPVDVDEPVDFGTGLVATVVSIDAVDLGAQGPGETAGPGAAITVELTNDTGAAIDVTGVVVNARADDAPVAPNFTDDRHQPFEGELAPGETATATYTFRIDHDRIESMVVDLHHDGSPNVIVVRATEA